MPDILPKSSSAVRSEFEAKAAALLDDFIANGTISPPENEFYRKFHLAGIMNDLMIYEIYDLRHQIELIRQYGTAALKSVV